MDSNQTQCPLCGKHHLTPFYSDSRRSYLRCATCQLISVPDTQLLSETDEQAEYELHRNNPIDAAYRRFLNRLFEPLNARLPAASYGLDFGCGPGPTLSLMFEEAGHSVALFDKFFAADNSYLNNHYNFITASEVVEHLHQPMIELEQLWSLLKPGGWLGIITKLALNRNAFAQWHYKNDPTHIRFFSRASFEWLAEQWESQPQFIGSDVILLQKSLTT